MKRNVIEINEELCIGCGLCATACLQGAIEIIDGKAKLTSDSYCDGLGMCLPKCPVDAIHMVEKETDSFDTTRKNIKLKEGGCGGTAITTFDRESVPLQTVKTITNTQKPTESRQSVEGVIQSELMQWPVQLKLVSANAPYFQNADLLIAADCTAFAYGDFHRDFIKNKVTVIGCPKLDDNQYNQDKIAEILKQNSIKSITVVRMEVPCCNGIIHAVKEAMLAAKCIVPYSEVVISTDGRIK
ncbi:4Fe-4S binding protein [Fusibacter tunisiensis]|uniref:Pyruvate/2-oxoacid:ferredoxin oxidoreductase delta subunit n=1 Tax=Fusibacter tunisiensis TaxID=1008308 RepID=A0ABS2MR07_9FIRM|nr:Pyruvate/2-oxoacid:ferredoxin oxidoreductase delta subunit [Fusibacter tunisiensis]